MAGLVTPVQPPLLHAVDAVARAAHDGGRLGGHLRRAGRRSRLTPLLLGLGIDELSMNAAAIPAVKAAVRAVTLDRAAALATHVLSLTTAAEIDAALAQFSAQLQAEREGGNR
ncbi:MAG: putative PEP-binding protein [Caldilineaceae bacterium]